MRLQIVDVVRRIMTAPFEDREGWEMTALALDGSVYIELHDPPDIRAKRSGLVFLAQKRHPTTAGKSNSPLGHGSHTWAMHTRLFRRSLRTKERTMQTSWDGLAT